MNTIAAAAFRPSPHPRTASPSVLDWRLAAAAVLMACPFAAAPLSAADDEEATPDFELHSSSIEIHRYTPATAEALNTAAAKPIRVEIEKDCTMADFAKVCGHTWIEHLKLESSGELIDSLAPVAGLTSLRELEVRSQKLSKETPFDLAPLAGLTELEVLDCYATRVTNTAALQGLTKLVEISFYMSGVDSIEFLRHTPLVEDLELYGTKHTFENYEPVLALPKLRVLGVYMNPQAVDDKLAVLAGVTTLEEFSMSNCKQVTTLDFLSGSAATLKSLSANWCTGLTDFSALHEFVAMEDLSLWDFPGDDLSFLTKMPKLERLGLQGVQISDLSIFAGLTSLRSCSLEKEHLPADAEAKLAEMLPDVRFSIRD